MSTQVNDMNHQLKRTLTNLVYKQAKALEEMNIATLRIRDLLAEQIRLHGAAEVAHWLRLRRKHRPLELMRNIRGIAVDSPGIEVFRIICKAIDAELKQPMSPE